MMETTCRRVLYDVNVDVVMGDVFVCICLCLRLCLCVRMVVEGNLME
jgi:hypothetical protein